MTLNRVFRGVPAALILLLGLGCAGRNTPATTGDTITDVHAGQFVWQDLVTDDVPASQRFYGQLLGWQFEETTRLGQPYLLVRSGNHLIGGIVSAERESPDQPIAQWLSYVRVDDVNQIVESVKRAGGTVLVNPVRVGSSGVAAVISDPQSAILGLLQSSEEAPEESQNPPFGEFFWREYLTPDSAQALSFYTGTFGYQGELSEELGDETYHILRRFKPRAGIVKINAIPVRPNWLPYVRVEDPVALANRVADLGGQVLLEPNPNARNSSLAIVSDPAGAAIALQKWPF